MQIYSRFGRKILAIMTIPLVVVAKIVIIFSPNLIVYNIFNFLAAAGGAVNYLVAFTLSKSFIYYISNMLMWVNQFSAQFGRSCDSNTSKFEPWLSQTNIEYRMFTKEM